MTLLAWIAVAHGQATADIEIDPIQARLLGIDPDRAEARLSSEIEDRPIDARLFGGLQIDVWMVKRYGQLQVASTSSVGAHTGLRVAI